jgi:hypothetical protein
MTQSKVNNTITLDLSDYSLDTDDIYAIDIDSTLTADTINISDYITSSADDITFDFDNISISATLWTEVLPDVDTVNNMCAEYPALAKAYENFQTVYKLVEQDYKGKKEDLDL